MIASTPIEGAAAMRRVRKQRHAEAQHAVRSELQHHAREDHGTGRRRFRVRVGQPGVQREERHLDREREEKREEKKQFRCWRAER